MRPFREPILIAVLVANLICLNTPASGQVTTVGPVRLAGPDVSGVLSDLGSVRLESPVPIVFFGSDREIRQATRDWQVALLEARTFWRSLLGAGSDTGLLFVDSPIWVACGFVTLYGFPGAVATSRQYGRLAVLATEGQTTYSEEALTAVRVAPVAYRGMLIAHDLMTIEGVTRHTEAMVWVSVAEDLVGEMRIGTQSWWQARLVGAAAAWLFLESPRGRELSPGSVEALEGWGWFWREYLNPVAVTLADAVQAPPSGDHRLVLELDARLIAFGRAIYDSYGRDAFERFRRAWPYDASFENIQESLAALWAEMPELREWEATLLTPQSR
jgi:hypothetical protein